MYIIETISGITVAASAMNRYRTAFSASEPAAIKSDETNATVKSAVELSLRS